jgi:hypothetical protein
MVQAPWCSRPRVGRDRAEEAVWGVARDYIPDRPAIGPCHHSGRTTGRRRFLSETSGLRYGLSLPYEMKFILDKAHWYFVDRTIVRFGEQFQRHSGELEKSLCYGLNQM